MAYSYGGPFLRTTYPQLFALLGRPEYIVTLNLCSMAVKNQTIVVQGTEITIIQQDQSDYISLTDMLKAKDGDFFIADWLRNRNTIEFLGI